MTAQQASEVVALLNAAFPSYTMEERSVEVWVALLSELHDVDAATRTVLGYARRGERFPTFSDFRRSYLREFGSNGTAAGRAAAALEAGPRLEVPESVRRWVGAAFKRSGPA